MTKQKYRQTQIGAISNATNSKQFKLMPLVMNSVEDTPDEEIAT
jgi:hypothetical protein